MSSCKHFVVEFEVSNDLSRKDIEGHKTDDRWEPLEVKVGDTLMFRSNGLTDRDIEHADVKTKATVINRALRSEVEYANRYLRYGTYVDGLSNDPIDIAEELGIEAPDGFEITGVELDWQNGNRRGTRKVFARAEARKVPYVQDSDRCVVEKTIGMLELGKHDSYQFHSKDGGRIGEALTDKISKEFETEHRDTIRSFGFSCDLARAFNRQYDSDCDVSPRISFDRHLYRVPKGLSFHDFKEAATKAYRKYFRQFGLHFRVTVETRGDAGDVASDATEEQVSIVLGKAEVCIDLVEGKGYDECSSKSMSHAMTQARESIEKTAMSLRLAADRCESRLGEIQQVADNVRVKREQETLPASAQIF